MPRQVYAHEPLLSNRSEEFGNRGVLNLNDRIARIEKIELMRIRGRKKRHFLLCGKRTSIFVEINIRSPKPRPLHRIECVAVDRKLLAQTRPHRKIWVCGEHKNIWMFRTIANERGHRVDMLDIRITIEHDDVRALDRLLNSRNEKNTARLGHARVFRRTNELVVARQRERAKSKLLRRIERRLKRIVESIARIIFAVKMEVCLQQHMFYNSSISNIFNNMTPENCIFCKIIAGQIPCTKIYEDERSFAFLDINPINEGHTLVIPKHHAENIMTVRKEDLAAVMETVRTLAPKIQRAVNADGINIGINNGSAAGQLVFHMHVHVMPRKDGDGYAHWHREEKPTSEALEKTANTIRAEL